MTGISTRRYTLAVLGVLALAFIVRLAAALYLGNHVTGLSGAQDEVTYSTLAERFVTGHGLTFPKPWYPWIQANTPQSYFSATMSLYLAAIYQAFGYEPIIARIITGVLSTFIVLMIVLIANRLFGRPVALVAGVIASVYAYLIFYGVTLVTETPSILSLLAAIYLAYRIGDSPSLKKWALLGVALATTILFRQAVMFYVPLLLLWVVYRQRGPKKMVLIPIVIIVLFILPFTVRNYLLWHRFLLLQAEYGHVFWNGNHPGQHGNFVSDRVFPIPSAVLASHNDVEITNTLLFMGIDHVLKDPGGFALLTL
ncbi:MAG: glycosyltransferase family 39 protein, partial [Chloroflexi bacterium]|nr:glycosyltransferase family 39 protein [Chloroflexota bacterium]